MSKCIRPTCKNPASGSAWKYCYECSFLRCGQLMSGEREMGHVPSDEDPRPSRPRKTKPTQPG